MVDISQRCGSGRRENCRESIIQQRSVGAAGVARREKGKYIMADIDSHLIFRLRGFGVQANYDISSGEKQKKIKNGRHHLRIGYRDKGNWWRDSKEAGTACGSCFLFPNRKLFPTLHHYNIIAYLLVLCLLKYFIVYTYLQLVDNDSANPDTSSSASSSFYLLLFFQIGRGTRGIGGYGGSCEVGKRKYTKLSLSLLFFSGGKQYQGVFPIVGKGGTHWPIEHTPFYYSIISRHTSTLCLSTHTRHY